MNKLIYLFLVIVIPASAQKADYKTADKFSEWNLRNIIGSLSVVPHSGETGAAFWYDYEISGRKEYYYVDPVRKIHEKLFDLQSLATMIKEQLGITLEKARPSDIVFSEDGKALKISVDTFWFKLDLKSKVLKQLFAPKKRNYNTSNTWVGPGSDDGKFAAFVSNHNVYLLDLQTGDTTQLTFDGEEKYSFEGVDDKIAEGSMNPHITWFAGKNKFYIVRSDYRKVSSLTLTSSLNPRAKPETFIFYMPGDKNVPQHELFIFDAETKSALKVPVEKWKDQTLKIIDDGRDGFCERLYFIRKKRTCDELELCKINPSDGSVKILFNEVCKPYFNNELYHLSILNEGRDILWHSERTGYGHYYHYDGEGNFKNAITSGEWVAGEIEFIDEAKREIYFYGYGQVKGENPYYARLNRASLDGKFEVRCLTPEMATHSISFVGPDKKYFVDNYSRADLEPVSVVRDLKGKVILKLKSPDLVKLYELGWQKPEPIHVKAADGETDLYGFMWKPYKMEPGRKYPIISHVYPGPTSEDMSLSFNPAELNTALAQVGFIVVNFGHRGGSPLRDAKYHKYGYGNLRDYPLADDKYGLEQLAEQYDFIDLSRVGIYGHSGGGLMSTSAICTYPSFYKAAVSSSGNHDSNTFNLWWGETHHGVKEVHKQVERKIKNPVNGLDSVYTEDVISFESKIPTNMELAKRLEGHLLLITGDADQTVNPSNTMRMADALVKAGKKFDLWVYPGQRHAYMTYYRDLYIRQLWFHFGKHLLGDYSSEAFVNMKDYKKGN